MAQGRPKIVLLGMMTPMPVAGVVWQNLHYLLGFERLGFETYYVETHARTPSMLMSSEGDDSAALAAEFIAAVMRRFGLSERWAFRALHDDGRCFGMSEVKLGALFREAALLINLHGGTQPLPELAASGRLVYLETDPVQLQLELHHGLRETIEFLEPHSAFFTFAENWGHPDCGLPPVDERFEFVPTRQPVVMDLWPDRSPQPADLFTTIGNWRQDWREVTFKGERYTWSKHHEFLRYLDLPERTGREFELALSSSEPEDREMLEARGWRVRDALGISRGIDEYRDYVGASRGEFTVAKDQNVRLRTGWFSDRSATYLASGRPVVTQDTGFGSALPTGAGLFPFASPEEAAEAVAAIDADYSRHAAAARELAQEYFSHEVVLAAMLDSLGLSPRRSRSPRPSALFPLEMEIEPVSRRPTTLARETVAAARRLPVSVHPEAPRLGPGSASVVVVTYNGLSFNRLCLESVLANTAADFELIVVDNHSEDGTRSYLAQLADSDARVRVLLNGRNAGFAPACNQGLALAQGDHLVLLNNDTMVPPGWLRGLLEHLREPGVGLVGPVTNRIGNEAEIETHYRTWGEFLELARIRAEQHAGEWLEMRTPAMFCLAMRRQTYRHLGPIDERYEVGLLEDDDYADRARVAGYQLRCAEDSIVHHFGEASFGRLVADGEYSRILRANQQRYAEKWGRSWEPYGRRANPRYEREAEQLREAVKEAVPAGAAVLVISRGDDGLLELNGRRAMHFPQGEDGGWSGHHPADSEEAVGHLEALRERGAEYLVVPPTYRWWLDHYEGLRQHLEGRYRAVRFDEQAGAIYHLDGEQR